MIDLQRPVYTDNFCYVIPCNFGLPVVQFIAVFEIQGLKNFYRYWSVLFYSSVAW